MPHPGYPTAWCPTGAHLGGAAAKPRAAPGSSSQQGQGQRKSSQLPPIAPNCLQLPPLGPAPPTPRPGTLLWVQEELGAPGSVGVPARFGQPGGTAGLMAPAGVSTAPCPSSAPLPAPPGQTWAEPAHFLSPKHSCRLCRDKDLAEASLPQGRASCWRWGRAGALLTTFPVNSGVSSHCWAGGTAPAATSAALPVPTARCSQQEGLPSWEKTRLHKIKERNERESRECRRRNHQPPEKSPVAQTKNG